MILTSVFRNAFSVVSSYFSILKISDVIDILLMTAIIYYIMKIVRSRTARTIFIVVVAFLVLDYISSIAGLNSLNYVLDRAIDIGLVALVVVFQPEIRRVLERFGGSAMRLFMSGEPDAEDPGRIIHEVVQACSIMSTQRVGALIVFERQNSLEDYYRTGVVVDAQVSAELLRNIFFPKASLHDGAVVLRQYRIAAAGCVLPLSDDTRLSKDLGTRHRAALGASERTDAVVVVVSEETGAISCAIGGEIRRFLTTEQLSDILRTELVQETKKPIQYRVRDTLLKPIKSGEEDQHEE